VATTLNKKKKIAIITGSRAEYGLLYWVIKSVHESPEYDLQLCVTGMHLSEKFGNTIDNIKQDGFSIAAEVNIQLEDNSEQGVSNSMALCIQGFSKIWPKLKPDLVIVLGDRFEILASVASTIPFKIPIAHCHGGESTEGAFDDQIRHAITKLSHLHFASSRRYADRIIQMGEPPENVFNVGAFGIESILNLNLLERKELESQINFTFHKANFLITYHPVTLSETSSKSQFQEVLRALENYKDTGFIFTYPNADNDSDGIIELIYEFAQNHAETSLVVKSLGQLRYLSSLKEVDLVIGNSSSGIIEVPYFKIPTINIGNRQKGRDFPKSVINCVCSAKEIKNSIDRSLSMEFTKQLKDTKMIYGDGTVSKSVMKILNERINSIQLNKPFYEK
jgi:GDP/UDP-N,N'-diacetylbacillosamine 2-epimerase (hydrolysing)